MDDVIMRGLYDEFPEDGVEAWYDNFSKEVVFTRTIQLDDVNDDPVEKSFTLTQLELIDMDHRMSDADMVSYIAGKLKE